MIPYGRQSIDDADIEAVIDVLRSDFITQGPLVLEFEQAVAQKCKATYATATNSATSALHIACMAIGLQENDIVWTSPISFVASANCVLYCNATIDFVDIDPDTYNMSIDCLEKKLEEADKLGKLPKALIPVHLSGQSCEMEKIHKLANRYQFKIIEDASHAIGGSYKSMPVGGCKYSDITIFSFHPVKIITTGEGGMALTNDATLQEKMQRLRSHGVTRDTNIMQNKTEGAWYYEQHELGYNYRITDLACALGISQLEKLDEFVSKRNQIAIRYDKLFHELEFQLPKVIEDCYSSYHLYIIRISSKAKINRKRVFENLRANGILVNVHYIPIYHHPYYQKFQFNRGDFPNAEVYYQEAISLPIFPSMTEMEQDFIVETLKKSPGFQTLF